MAAVAETSQNTVVYVVATDNLLVIKFKHDCFYALSIQREFFLRPSLKVHSKKSVDIHMIRCPIYRRYAGKMANSAVGAVWSLMTIQVCLSVFVQVDSSSFCFLADYKIYQLLIP